MGGEKEWEGWLLFLLHAPRVEKNYVSYYYHGSKRKHQYRTDENYYKWREQDPNEAPYVIVEYDATIRREQTKKAIY